MIKDKDIRESWKCIENKKITFDEAIRYCEKLANYNESWAMSYHRDYYANEEEDYDFLLKQQTRYVEDARKHRQIIEWLRNYQRLLKAIDDIKAEIMEQFEGCDICRWDEDYDYEENNISEYKYIDSICSILKIIDEKVKEQTDET